MRPGASPDGAGTETLRMAEVLAALSVVTDMARGHPPEEAMRACLLATFIGRRLRLPETQLADTYYAALLRYIGCTATSPLLANFAGDDVAVRRLGDLVDTTVPREALGFLWRLSRGNAAARSFQTARMLLHVPAVATEGLAADCEVGARLVARFGFPATFEAALLHAFERWDGHGAPHGVRGDAIPLPMRLATLGYAVVMFDAIGGQTAAIEAVQRWSGRIIDPMLAAEFLDSPAECLATTIPDDVWAAVVDSEPRPHRMMSETMLTAVASGFGDMADLKSHFLTGHSSGVARLAEGAVRQLHVAEAQTQQLLLAALLHDVGRVGIGTGIWEKPAPLSRSEWEEVRLHPYHAERMLSRAPVLLDAARVVCRHHERLGGGGYPAGIDGHALDLSSRILAAADVYHALQEDRPYRPAKSSTEAARVLREQCAPGGGLDATACDAVLAGAGTVTAIRRQYPVGLTEREVEVLQHLARGRTEREIAQWLTISPSTVHTHVVHIYDKAGVSTRAGATLFALEHQLLPEKIH